MRTRGTPVAKCVVQSAHRCCHACAPVATCAPLLPLYVFAFLTLFWSADNTPMPVALSFAMWYASLFLSLFLPTLPSFPYALSRSAVYAPWCASCRSFAPTYVAIARAIAASPRGGSVRVARVDGWTYSVLCRRFRVNAFPSFVVFQGGYVYEHTGRWSPQGLVTFALPPPLRQSDPAPSAADRDEGATAAGDEGDGDGNSDGDRGAATREYAAERAQEDVVVNGARVDRPFGPMAPHWRLATYLSAVGGELAAVGRDMSTVQLGGVVVGSGMALTVVIVVGLAVLTTPGVFKFD